MECDTGEARVWMSHATSEALASAIANCANGKDRIQCQALPDNQKSLLRCLFLTKQELRSKTILNSEKQEEIEFVTVLFYSKNFTECCSKEKKFSSVTSYFNARS